jgi:hypothetical protein
VLWLSWESEIDNLSIELNVNELSILLFVILHT